MTYPAETENALAAHPGVADVAAFGVPDDDLGEILVATVTAAGAPLDEADLLAWLRERIAVHKLPRHIRVAAAIPRSEAGKILRRELSASWSGDGPGPAGRRTSGARRSRP